MRTTSKIVIADDHPLIIDGIKLMLEGEEAYEVVGTANSVRELFSIVQTENPDLAVLDLNMSGDNILDYIEELKIRFPRLRTLVISSYDAATFVKIGQENGLNGYILKNTNKADFLDVLEKIMNGGQHFVKQNLNDIHDRNPEIIRDDFFKKGILSEREIEIICLIAKGQTEQEIADFLFLSKHTIHTHRKNIMKKLNIHSAVGLVRFAYDNKLL